jgi:hypothetical protein
MARLINRLNDRKVKTITRKGAHPDGGGLYPLVDGSRRYWFFRYMKNGKDRQYGIGAAHTWDLAEARKKARELRQAISDGRASLSRGCRRQRDDDIRCLPRCLHRCS